MTLPFKRTIDEMMSIGDNHILGRGFEQEKKTIEGINNIHDLLIHQAYKIELSKHLTDDEKNELTRQVIDKEEKLKGLKNLDSDDEDDDYHENKHLYDKIFKSVLNKQQITPKEKDFMRRFLKMGGRANIGRNITIFDKHNNRFENEAAEDFINDKLNTNSRKRLNSIKNQLTENKPFIIEDETEEDRERYDRMINKVDDELKLVNEYKTREKEIDENLNNLLNDANNNEVLEVVNKITQAIKDISISDNVPYGTAFETLILKPKTDEDKNIVEQILNFILPKEEYEKIINNNEVHKDTNFIYDISFVVKDKITEKEITKKILELKNKISTNSHEGFNIKDTINNYREAYNDHINVINKRIKETNDKKEKGKLKRELRNERHKFDTTINKSGFLLTTNKQTGEFGSYKPIYKIGKNGIEGLQSINKYTGKDIIEGKEIVNIKKPVGIDVLILGTDGLFKYDLTGDKNHKKYVKTSVPLKNTKNERNESIKLSHIKKIYKDMRFLKQTYPHQINDNMTESVIPPHLLKLVNIKTDKIKTDKIKL